MITLKIKVDQRDSLEVGFNEISKFYFCDYWRKQADNSLKQIATVCADTLKELFDKMIFERKFFQNSKIATVYDVVDFYSFAKQFLGVR